MAPVSDRRVAATLVAVTLVAALGMLAAGCATQTATPGEPDEPPPATSAPRLPPRPAEIRIDEVDPCTLLSPQQQQQLGIDRPPDPGGGSGRGEPACSYNHLLSEPFHSFNVVTVPFEGAEAWLTRGEDRRIIDVAGFGAVETRTAGALGSCTVIVDIAEGQSLGVLFTGDGEGSFTGDEMCDKARQAATAATETVLAR